MDTHRPVHLIVPAEPGSVRLARLVAAGVAADAGLSIDDTEDLRIAVSELVALLIEGADEAADQVTIDYTRAEGEVRVEGRCEVPSARAGEPLDDLVLEILRVVVDDHDFVVEERTRRFRLVKRARVAT